MKDLFIEERAVSRSENSKPKREIAAVYDYNDLDGNVIHSTIRYNPKSFIQRRPDPDKPGEYIWKEVFKLMKTIAKVKKQINPGLNIDGVLMTLVDNRTNLARATEETIRRQYGNILKIYETRIPVSVKAAETSAVGQSIFTYDGGSRVAEAYAELVREVLADGKS